VTSSVDGITAPHHGKSYREWRSLFSYSKYNQAAVNVQMRSDERTKSSGNFCSGNRQS
jgi:hypothetical protein